MCNVCCKEFQGWCRAFTTIEVILSILQAVLLTLFVAFLTFLILHLVVCSDKTKIAQPDEVTSKSITTESDPTNWITTQVQTSTLSKTGQSEETNSYSQASENDTTWSTVSPDIACTWTPLVKTSAVTQYFEHAIKSTPVTLPTYDEFENTTENDVLVSDEFDGLPASNEKSFIMALVKMRPPDDILFGCILTIISEFWTLTAASCVEYIEEVDSLDSFTMMENFGELRHGRTHLVTDVLIHPQYQGVNKTYDIVALKSEDRLTSKSKLLTLPTMLDYLLIAVGERLTILGYGKFRSIDKSAFSRGARAVTVHVLPSAQCSARVEAWNSRHLERGMKVARVHCGTAALCAGPLRARDTPCNYCAGTPLLQKRVLLGLMSDPGPCGAPCEPSLYVNLATIRNWLNMILGND